MPKADVAHKDQVFSPPFVLERVQNGSLTQDEVEALWHEHIDPEYEEYDEDADYCYEEQLAYFRHAVNQLCSSRDSEGEDEDDDKEENESPGVDYECDDEDDKLKSEFANLESRLRAKCDKTEYYARPRKKGRSEYGETSPEELGSDYKTETN